MESLWLSFLAFNQNAASYLAYAISNNLWYLLIAVGVAACIFLHLKEEIMVTVHEEQRAL